METCKKPLTIADLALVEYISSPDSSPEGKNAAFVIRVADGETGGFKPRVYEIPVSGGEYYRLTSDDADEDLPKYSPDGKYIAFLSTVSGEKQIWLYDRISKGKTMLTSLRHGVNWFSWSEDGKAIAFDAPLWPGEEELAFITQTPEEKADWLRKRANSPIVIEDLYYKFDETYGITDGSYTQIGVVNIADGSTRMLTSGKINYKMPVFSPDGKTLAFYGCPYDGHRVKQNQVFTCELNSGSVNQITDELRTPASSALAYSDRGIIFLSYVFKDNLYTVKPHIISPDGGEIKNLFPEDCPVYGIDTSAIGRTQLGSENPAYQISGGSLFFLTSNNGAVNLYEQTEDGSVKSVIGGDISIHSFCPLKSGKIIYTKADTKTMAEVFARDIETGADTRLTYTNKWLEGCDIPTPEEMWVETKDKTAKIHGFVIKPVGYEEGKLYPAVLDIHGGPEAFYSHDFWFEFQYLASRGFAVVYCDPRGSAGFGPEFQKGEHAWGNNAYDDLMTFIDAATSKGFIDPNRLGVTGGSYGGRMTNDIIGRTNRFGAAVTQRTLCNLSTSYGTGDMGSVRSDKNFKTMMKMLTDRLKSRSTTLTGIDNVKTPLLILHGTNDYRCSFEQAEQMFIAMKDRNPEIPVKLVVFPGENHNLTRGGKLHFQQAHLKEMADWFDKYIGEGGADE